MNLHDKTKDKIQKLFKMSDEFCETQNEKYSGNPDIIFIVNAFETAFGEFSFKIRNKKEYSFETYHDEIFNLDNILSSWREHLTYNLPDNDGHKNDLYSVLFSILQGAETIIEDDHFYWEEDAEAESDEDISDEEDEMEEYEDADYMEKTF